MRVHAVAALLLVACEGGGEDLARHSAPLTTVEDLEAASKVGYAPAEIALNEGRWVFADALVGSLPGDRKHGAQAARVRQLGRLTMRYDRDGAGSVTVWHASYGNDTPSAWQLYASTNSGAGWFPLGEPVQTSPVLAPATIDVGMDGPVRFELRKLDGGAARINFDDIAITDYDGPEPDAAPPEPSVVEARVDDL